MDLNTRINSLIEAAYKEGQTTVRTTVQFYEICKPEELDQLIVDLKARGFGVSYDDVLHDMIIGLPAFTFAERARILAYSTDALVRKYIESTSRHILHSANLGYTSQDEFFYELADPKVIDHLQEHFSREDFKVTRSYNDNTHETKLNICWKK